MRQWGVSIPGGAEAVVHWRATAEQLAMEGVIAPFVAFDIDLVNMYGSIEWPCIRQSTTRHFQEAEGWTRWSHEQPFVTVLPCGSEATSDRGAQQGDTFGSVQAALPLGDAREAAEMEYNQTLPPGSASGVCDEWYMDDGQALVAPSKADLWLKCLDKALGEIGATRVSSDGDIKSVARLVCPPGHERAFDGWATPHISSTCKVRTAADGAEILGTVVGSRAKAVALAETVKDKAASVQSAIEAVSHPATELVLTRRCADVSKFMYVLRTIGDQVGEDTMTAFDLNLRHAVEGVLGGAMPDTSWWQAIMGVRFGGLGLRESATVALPAFLASRIASRPLVHDMASHMEQAGLATVTLFTRGYDERTKQAVDRLYATLPEAVTPELRTLFEAAAADCERTWQRLKEGGDSVLPPGVAAGGAVIADAGEADDEHPFSPHRPNATGLRREIGKVVDGCIRCGLQEFLQSAHRWPDISRINELSDGRVNHTWMWALSPHHGAVMSDAEYVEAVRLRLGTAGPTEPLTCGQCDKHLLDSACAHALCCAPGASTRGHYAVVRKIFDVVQQVDHGAETEAAGLIPSAPTLRPADILTHAACSGRAAALDVGTASPDSSHAGADCLETMHADKVAKYAPYRSALERQT